MPTHFEIFDFLLSAVLTQIFLVSANKCGEAAFHFIQIEKSICISSFVLLGSQNGNPFKINIDLVILMKYNSVYVLLNFCFYIWLYSTSSTELNKYRGLTFLSLHSSSRGFRQLAADKSSLQVTSEPDGNTQEKKRKKKRKPCFFPHLFNYVFIVHQLS